MSKFIFKLGDKAKDKITGFEGIIAGRAEHITGCNTYGLKPPVDKDGNIKEAQWLDEGVIDIIPGGINKEEVKAKVKGGPQENPKI